MVCLAATLSYPNKLVTFKYSLQIDLFWSESAECTPGDVFKYVGEHAIFASGSPFHDVLLGMISRNLHI